MNHSNEGAWLVDSKCNLVVLIMLNNIIKFSLNNRFLVLVTGMLVVVYGSLVLRDIPVDVFPDLTRPTVTLMTEAHGMASEEVEVLITTPLENNLNGMPGLERIRSISSEGLSVIFLEFSWDSDIYLVRQFVSEKLISSREYMPRGATTTMGPISSLMGQIQLIALTASDKSIDEMEIREIADWVIRPRILSIEGVAQVIPLGGKVKQYQIVLDPHKINKYQISLDKLEASLSEIGSNSPGGYQSKGTQTFLVRNIANPRSIEDIERTYIDHYFGEPVYLKDIAQVKIGEQYRLGDGGYNGRPAVVLSIQKQPLADTVRISKEIDRAIDGLSSSLPEGLIIDTSVFKQANFIERSISGVKEKLRNGSILVLIVLLIFLANLRMSIITITAIPLSFCVTFIILYLFGLSVNTMTLGGLAIAIGELVDDSIVDVENIFRRIKENSTLASPKSLLKTIFLASSEVRNSIVLSTIIIALVFMPLFYLSGLEGRLLVPLGVAYLTALFASLVVSLTITPVLSYYFFKKGWKNLKTRKEPFILALLKNIEGTLLSKILNRPLIVIMTTLLVGLSALFTLSKMGRDFLPPFNEGTAMLSVYKPVDVSLERSMEIGQKVERALMSIEGVKSVSRRTGRSEEDEHIMPVHISEIDINFDDSVVDHRPILDEIRFKLEEIENISISIGQQISHLMDHMLSGVSAQVAIKIFSRELSDLRAHALNAYQSLSDIEGLVDLRIEQQQLVPQLRIHLMRNELGKALLTPGEISEHLESLLYGKKRGFILESERVFDIFSFVAQDHKNDVETLNSIPLKTLPNGELVTLYDVADVYLGRGPNEIHRENKSRRILLSANISGRDLGSTVEEVDQVLSDKLQLGEGDFYTIGGQFEAQREASRKIFLFSILSTFLIIVILFINFRSLVLTAQIFLSIPMALTGGVFFLYYLEGSLTVAAMVGFIALAGIASRNAVMLISHYLHLMKYEGESFGLQMIVRGTQERLAPMLMTALTAFFALLPLLFAKGESGSEILYPVAVVITGGLITSTLFDIFVTPVIFYNFAKNASYKLLQSIEERV